MVRPGQNLAPAAHAVRFDTLGRALAVVANEAIHCAAMEAGLLRRFRLRALSYGRQLALRKRPFSGRDCADHCHVT